MSNRFSQLPENWFSLISSWNQNQKTININRIKHLLYLITPDSTTAPSLLQRPLLVSEASWTCCWKYFSPKIKSDLRQCTFTLKTFWQYVQVELYSPLSGYSQTGRHCLPTALFAPLCPETRRMRCRLRRLKLQRKTKRNSCWLTAASVFSLGVFLRSPLNSFPFSWWKQNKHDEWMSVLKQCLLSC